MARRRSLAPVGAILISLAVASSLVSGAQALYSSSSPVTQLTADNFESSIKKKGGVWIVE